MFTTLKFIAVEFLSDLFSFVALVGIISVIML